jgi:uncharacterized protein YlbG (UPF0298 family)
MKMKTAKILIYPALTFISLMFRYEILYAKYVELSDKLKEIKKCNFFIELTKKPFIDPHNAGLRRVSVAEAIR